MTGDEHSTHQMVANLHIRFTGMETQLGQLALEHKELKTEVGVLRDDLRDVEARVDKHEGLAGQQLMNLNTGQERIELKFDKHVEKGEQDRVWLFRLIVMTLVSAAAGLAMSFFGG